jgi:hypothetical protein
MYLSLGGAAINELISAYFADSRTRFLISLISSPRESICLVHLEIEPSTSSAILFSKVSCLLCDIHQLTSPRHGELEVLRVIVICKVPYISDIIGNMPYINYRFPHVVIRVSVLV